MAHAKARDWPHADEVLLMIFDHIESFYTRCRLHSSLDDKSPLEFESPNQLSSQLKIKKPSPLFWGKITLKSR